MIVLPLPVPEGAGAPSGCPNVEYYSPQELCLCQSERPVPEGLSLRHAPAESQRSSRADAQRSTSSLQPTLEDATLFKTYSQNHRNDQ